MELVSIFISDFNGTLGSYININSSFETKYSDGTLTLHKGEDRTRYYDEIPSSLLVGRNGSGKTTILNFIESFHYEDDAQGFSVWFHNDQFYLLAKSFDIGNISTKHVCNIVHNPRDFFKKYLSYTLKTNNAVDFNSMLFGVKKSRAPNFIDISLSITGRTKRKRKHEIEKIFDFINSSGWLPDTINRENIKIIASVNLSGSSRVKKALYDRHFSKRFESNFIETFSFYLEEYQQRRSATYSLDDGTSHYPFINRTNFNSYLKFKNENWGLSFFSFMFSKPALEINNEINHHALVFNMVPSMLYALAKELGFEHESDIQFIFLTLLIAVFFSNEQNVIYNLDYEIRRASGATVIEPNAHEMIRDFSDNLKKLDELASALKKLSLRATPKGNLLEFSISHPNVIMDVIGLINSLPKQFDSIVSIEWNGLSSGEVSLLHMFSGMYYELERLVRIRGGRKSLLILIDEIDLYLHPEWQRVIFSNVLTFLGEFKKHLNIQLIISSHSPIVSSDFLPVDLIALSRGSGSRIIAGKIDGVGFGESIEEYMTKGFFLQATVGERVLHTIKELINNRDDNNYISKQSYITELITNKVLNYVLGRKK